MQGKVLNIYLSSEFNQGESAEFDDEGTDVIVVFENGETYYASFVTFSQLDAQRARFAASGEFMNGKYFWMHALLLIDDCSRQNIESAIHYLLAESEFREVFKKI